MTPGVRAVVAYVAGRLISRTEPSSIFDFAGPGHRSMGGTVNESCVNVYDYSENCQITGSSSKGSFRLFHHKERIHISLDIAGETFRGYDHSAGRFFSGVVRGAKITLHDDADHGRYSYWSESPQCSQMPGQESADENAESDSQGRESEPGNVIGE